MKKIFFIVIVLVIVLCSGGIFYIMFLGNNSQDNNNGEEVVPVEYTNSATMTVTLDIMTSRLTYDATVVSANSSDDTEKIHLSWTNEDNAKLFKTEYSLGDDLSKGDILYSYNGVDFYAEYPCKIIGYSSDKMSVDFELLKHSNLYISTSVEFDKINLLDENTKTHVKVKSDIDDLEFDSKITYIGSQVENGLVNVNLELDENLLAGTPLEVTFEVVSDKKILTVPKAFLQNDGSDYFVEIKKGNDKDDREKRVVEIGETFQTYENDIVYEDVEILNGLTEGEVIVADFIE